MVLLKDGNKSFIMVVIEHPSNCALFCALMHPFTKTMVVQIFFNQIFKLHGMPTSVMFDRDPTFTSKFCKELFKHQGT